MSNVVNLDDRRAHVVGPMKCTECGHEFVSVRPERASAKWWECPRCHEKAATEVENG